MKRGRQETIAQKLDGLDTLSAGIVYGKEDAWDKLQGRIEQKPGRKLAWRWMAAAAILLLLVCISLLYNTPQEQAIANVQPTKEQEPMKQSAPAVAKKPIQTVRSEMLPAVRNRETPKVALQTTQPVVQPQVAPKTDEIANEPTAALPKENEPAPPVAVIKQPMKIYHVSDLERGAAPTQQPAVAATGENMDLQSLPTLHINDVIHQDEVLKDIRKANRTSWGKRLFSKPDPFYRDMPQEQEAGQYESDESRNPIKAILNIQN